MKRLALIILALTTPAVAFAQNATQLFAILNIVQKTLGYVMPIVIILGVIFVIWAIVGFVTKTNEEERAKAKMQIVYGIVGLFVIVSIWGLVAALQNLLGVGGGSLNSGQLPCVINTGSTAGC